MSDQKVYAEATKVSAKDGDVVLDGPDGIDLKMTPEAARKTSDDLMTESMKANGQRRMKDYPHRAK